MQRAYDQAVASSDAPNRFERDPFAPPHAAQPALLVGRDQSLEALQHVLDRLLSQRFATGIAFTGCRGIGKSVLLRRFLNECRERHILTVFASLHARSHNFDKHLAEAVRRAVSEESGRPEWRLRPTGRGIRAKAKGRIPFTGIDLEVEAGGGDFQDQLHQAFDRLFTVVTEYVTAAVIIFDEADFLSPEHAEIALVEPLGRGAEFDLPTSAVIAGTGRSMLRAVRGSSTFADGLMRPFRLQRLTHDEAHELLVGTARVGDQDWTDLDLSTVIDVCLGVPRWLHAAGRVCYCSLAEGDPASVVLERVVESVVTGRQSLESFLNPVERLVLRRVKDVVTDGPLDIDELAADLALQGIVTSNIEACGIVESLEQGGYIECDNRNFITAALT